MSSLWGLYFGFDSLCYYVWVVVDTIISDLSLLVVIIPASELCLFYYILLRIS